MDCLLCAAGRVAINHCLWQTGPKRRTAGIICLNPWSPPSTRLIRLLMFFMARSTSILLMTSRQTFQTMTWAANTRCMIIECSQWTVSAAR